MRSGRTTRDPAPSPASELAAERVLAGRLLAKNTVWNLVGQGAPLIAALFAIPVLLSALGPEGFGLLGIGWVVIGYFSVFDLGVGRALTHQIADRLGRGREDEIPGLIGTGTSLLLILGSVAGLLAGAVTPLVVGRFLAIPEELKSDALRAFLVLAASMPAVVGSVGLRGILEAFQEFTVVNLLRIPLGVFNFVGPLLVLPFTRSLTVIVTVLAAGRMLGFVGHFWACRTRVPVPWSLRIRPDMLRPLVTAGGWMTVSNVIAPLALTLDRFLLAAVATVAAVAYYATPYDIVTKLWIVPSAITGVLFPAFTSSFAMDPHRTRALFVRATAQTYLALLPPLVLVAAAGPLMIGLWLGPEAHPEMWRALRWMVPGVLYSSCALIGFVLLQAAGAARVAAVYHLVQLPLGIATFAFAAQRFGAPGAAAAWTVRCFVDMVVLYILGARRLGMKASEIVPLAAWVLAGSLAICGSGLLEPALLRAAFAAISLGALAYVAWGTIPGTRRG